MTVTVAPTQQDFATRTERHEEGIWDEQTTQDGVRVVTYRRPMPVQLIRQYAECAVRRASARQLDDGTWFAEIEGFHGVWANEPSAIDALDVLENVVFEWVILKIRDEDRDIPVIETFDLNSI